MDTLSSNIFGAPDKISRHSVPVMSADLQYLSKLHRSNRVIFDAVLRLI